MKKEVSLARALREKNRVAGKLREVRARVARENSKDKRVPRGVDVKVQFEDAGRLMQRLIAIKTAIAVANKDIVGTIIALEEAKSELNYLNGVDTKEGVFEEDAQYGQKTRIKDYECVIKQGELLEITKRLQKNIEALQDELDEFNATTRIEIEFDD